MVIPGQSASPGSTDLHERDLLGPEEVASPCMEYVIRFAGEHRCVTARTWGVADRHSLLALLEDIALNPRYTAGLPILIDLTTLDRASLAVEDLEALTRFVAGLEMWFDEAKLAVVVPTRASLGLSGVAWRARVNVRLPLRFFYECDDALGWLVE